MAEKKGVAIPQSSARIAIPGREGQYFEARDLSTTPGGTIYGVTPGGSRIVYDRETLLSLKNSPLSQTPPRGMAKIPGVTVPIDYHDEEEESRKAAAAAAAAATAKAPRPAASEDDRKTTFAMDD